MGEEAKRNTPFALALGDMLPNLAVHTFDTRPLGEGRTHINLVVENTGFLPTYTSIQGKKNKHIRPVRVEVEIPPGVQIVTGRARNVLGHLEGRSNKRDLFTFGASATDNRGRIEWVLQGDRGALIQIHVKSERAGDMTLETHLK
jgi:hypothetical protein